MAHDKGQQGLSEFEKILTQHKADLADVKLPVQTGREGKVKEVLTPTVLIFQTQKFETEKKSNEIISLRLEAD